MGKKNSTKIKNTNKENKKVEKSNNEISNNDNNTATLTETSIEDSIDTSNGNDTVESVLDNLSLYQASEIRSKEGKDPESSIKEKVNDTNNNNNNNNYNNNNNIIFSDDSEIKNVIENYSVEVLREKYIELNKNFSIQNKDQQEEIDELQRLLDQSRMERDDYEEQYNDLLSNLATVKNTIGERLKADSAELEKSKSTIEYLEKQNEKLHLSISSLTSELGSSTDSNEKLSKDLSHIRSEYNKLQDSWSDKENNLLEENLRLSRKIEKIKQTSYDWELLATEEKTVRESLSQRINELEEQLQSRTEKIHEYKLQKETYESSILQLKNNIEDLKKSHAEQISQMVDSMQSNIDELDLKLNATMEKYSKASQELIKVNDELKHAQSFESELKEKNLLVGKLRHETVTLNEHLTKALKLLKIQQTSPQDSFVDRDLLTNLILSFLQIPRGDTKRFEVLQLIAVCLNWSEEERGRAGLERTKTDQITSTVIGATGTGSFSSHRSVSSSNTFSNNESIASLWTEFLESEASKGERDSSKKKLSSKS